MLVVYRIQQLMLMACLLSGSAAFAGDAASELPASLAAGLRPIAEIRLDDMDTRARESIQLARQQLNAALQQQPVLTDKLAAAYGELGGLYQVHFVYPPAEDCYHNAMQLAADNFRWAYYAAYLADVEGRTRLALERYQHARKLKPGYKALTVRLGNVLLDLNELEQAQAAFARVVDATGLEAASLYGLGQVALLKREYATAIEAFTGALEIEPAASRIHYPLAQALRATQRNDEAKTQLALRGNLPPSIKDPQIESLEALKIGSRIHFIQAMKAIRQQDYTAAGTSFAQGLENEPDNVLARISYARTLHLTDDKAGARKALEAALDRQADNALGLFLLGILTEEQGDAARAVTFYQRAIRHTPDHAGAHQQLANQAYRQGNYIAAAQHYAASIKAKPDNLPITFTYIGTLLQGEVPATTVMTALANAIQRFPEFSGFRYLQILLLAASRDTDIQDPQTALKNAQLLNNKQQIPPHQELLGLAHAAAGDYEEAVSIQQALQSYTQRAAPAETDRIAKTLAYYQAGTLPPLDELINYTAFQPPAFNAAAVFRDYPAPRPY